MRVSMKSVLLTVLAALVGTVSFAQVTTSVLGGKTNTNAVISDVDDKSKPP